MIITSLPASVTVHAGTAAWASMLAAAIGVPAASPIAFAIFGVNPPALSPSSIISLSNFSATTLAILASNDLKNAFPG